MIQKIKLGKAFPPSGRGSLLFFSAIFAYPAIMVVWKYTIGISNFEASEFAREIYEDNKFMISLLLFISIILITLMFSRNYTFLNKKNFSFRYCFNIGPFMLGKEKTIKNKNIIILKKVKQKYNVSRGVAPGVELGSESYTQSFWRILVRDIEAKKNYILIQGEYEKIIPIILDFFSNKEIVFYLGHYRNDRKIDIRKLKV